MSSETELEEDFSLSVKRLQGCWVFLFKYKLTHMEKSIRGNSSATVSNRMNTWTISSERSWSMTWRLSNTLKWLRAHLITRSWKLAHTLHLMKQKTHLRLQDFTFKIKAERCNFANSFTLKSKIFHADNEHSDTHCVSPVVGSVSSSWAPVLWVHLC